MEFLVSKETLAKEVLYPCMILHELSNPAQKGGGGGGGASHPVSQKLLGAMHTVHALYYDAYTYRYTHAW